VDRDGLENRCTLTGTQGSNPCLSAKNAVSYQLAAFFFAGQRKDYPEDSLSRQRWRSKIPTVYLKTLVILCPTIFYFAIHR
ncbi:MAG: hypothetical protein K2M94_06760, partial [Paramuribaculum sp.]|nr:hypothetical protein [Paramuribaculum sp.]